MTQVVDFVTAPDPAECVAAGVIPCPYTGNARPSQAWFDDCRARGIAPLWMVQETISIRSQQGFQAGVLDCQFAEGRATERGHVGPIAVVVSDGNGGDSWDCSAYAQGWASVASHRFFPYGALGVTGSFLAAVHGHPLSIPGEWVPETWGQGRVAAQLVGPQANLSTAHDLNNVFYDFGQEVDMTPDESAKLTEVHGILTGGGQYPSLESRIETAIIDAVNKANGTVESGPSPAQVAALAAAKDALAKVAEAFK